jgi:hypothetical protein
VAPAETANEVLCARAPFAGVSNKMLTSTPRAIFLTAYISLPERILWLSTNLTVADRQTCHPHNALFFNLKRMPRN